MTPPADLKLINKFSNDGPMKAQWPSNSSLGRGNDATVGATLPPQAMAPEAAWPAEDADLFESPQDLICPITHELFYDPASW